MVQCSMRLTPLGGTVVLASTPSILILKCWVALINEPNFWQTTSLRDGVLQPR